ncbi:hypothetical protein [Halpernia humi]|uniref:hypothetical protein n=1 Tax=Halpernia humi TaxID=493375 RepID=UPI0011B090A7|nr:hypothetical protein [Halpernia humi]
MNKIIKEIINEELKHGHKLPNHIKEKIKFLSIYSETEEDSSRILIRQLPNVGLGKILNYKSNSFRKDSIALINQNEYQIKNFKIDKTINPKLILYKKGSTGSHFEISNPAYFEGNKKVYIQFMITDSLGDSEANSYILKNENGLWRVIDEDKLWQN